MAGPGPAIYALELGAKKRVVDARREAGHDVDLREGARLQPVVGMTNWAPSRMPAGQRAVVVFILV
ncbi:Uncharacterised protein [Starkeya nomas]|uniref:Uncharacterized protein n=1 Tax=Starkeya nomas TaxID=2666134 RepID=A0A5S9PPW6_9HYPH|nr:Uncharacterised protein [Starkeya nomas]